MMAFLARDLTAAAVLEEFGTTACGQSTIGSGAGES
jgi:hypothetical protein